MSRVRWPATFALLSMLAALLGLEAARVPRPQPVREAKSAPSDWFWGQRMLPDGSVPTRQLEAAREALLLERALTTSAGADWEPVGPYNIGGRVTALAATRGGQRVYLAAANGGVFRSDDAGFQWRSITDPIGLMSIGALAMHPEHPETLLVGTGEANGSVDSYDGDGVWRTDDGGDTWRHLGLAHTARISEVAIDPADPAHLLVAAMGRQFSTGPDRGLYRSTDGGASWTQVLFVNDSTGACDVVFHPTHPETVYAATWERIRRPTYRRAYGPGCGIWRSADGGATWTRLLNGLPAPGDGVGRIGLAIAPSRPSRVYAQIVSGATGGYSGLGMYRTDDGGQSWVKRDASGLFTNGFGGFGWYFGEVVADPANPDRVYAMGVQLMRSNDGGVSFTDITSDAHVDFHAGWIDPSFPSRMYVGSDGGFFSTLGGAGWVRSLDLPITQFYAGTVAAQDPAKVLGGTQDNGTLKTEAGPSAWSLILGGDGFVPVVDPVNASLLFAEWQFCSGGSGVKRSTNNGVSFSGTSGWSASDRYNWNTPYVMNPRSRHTLIAGSQRVYRSLNNGATWSPISGDLTFARPAGLLYGTLTTLAISAADTSLYLAGTDDGRVWRSDNRGGAWTEISAGLPRRYVTRVAADPSDPQVVYATLSGFGLDEAVAHVFRSTDRGAHWSAIDGNLPEVPANDLVVDPLDPQTLFVATDIGVFATRNLGGTWFPIGRGLPVQAVFDLELHAASRKLFAFTHGRSAWRFDLAALPVSAPAPPAPALALAAPLPHPARNTTTLTLALEQAGTACVVVHDLAGRAVRVLHDGALPAGRHALRWNREDDRGARVAAGVYFVRARVAGATRTQRVVVAD
jgi:photosystem II stability/assembly factor-like uncharacterized protein